MLHRPARAEARSAEEKGDVSEDEEFFDAIEFGESVPLLDTIEGAGPTLPGLAKAEESPSMENVDNPETMHGSVRSCHGSSESIGALSRSSGSRLRLDSIPEPFQASQLSASESRVSLTSIISSDTTSIGSELKTNTHELSMDHLVGTASTVAKSSSVVPAHPLAEYLRLQDGETESENGDALSIKTSVTRHSRLSGMFDCSASLSSLVDLSDARRYKKVKVKAKAKKQSEFDGLYLVQELWDPSVPNRSGNQLKTNAAASTVDANSIFAIKFSLDGHYLAAGGRDKSIRVWKLLAQEALDQQTEAADQGLPYEAPHLAVIFHEEPIQIFHGHESDVLDISWSRNNFLVSASMDRTVRLWHYSRPDCLGVFPHLDFVTSVAFHPRDDRLFLSGALDCRLRLWSIAEKRVTAWTELPAGNAITAVSFASNGKVALAGTASGICLLFETDGLKYHTQIHVRSRRGKNRKAKKISGIAAMPGKLGDEKILITSNDSRLRAYTLRDKSLFCKYIGLVNHASQICASFSDDGEYMISGSEDSRVCIWSVEGRHHAPSRLLQALTRQDRVAAHEYFKGSTVGINVAIFAPACVRNLLQSTGLRPLPSSYEQIEGSFANGQIIVAADANGRIKIFENNKRLPAWIEDDS